MELSIFSAATALIAAAALTWLVLRFFFGTQKATAGAMDASGERQSATITVKGGYSPAVISMRTGTPITLTFDRQETGECTSHVVFADLGLDAMLPGNATTDVELPALPAGEYPFACGMNMVHGLLRVEGEESKDGADKDGLRPRADGSAEAEGVSPSDLRVGAPVVNAAEAERREAAERANEIKALTKLVIVGRGTDVAGIRRHHAAYGQSRAGAALDGEPVAAGHSHHAGDVLLRASDPHGRLPRAGAPLPRHELAGLAGHIRPPTCIRW